MTLGNVHVLLYSSSFCSVPPLPVIMLSKTCLFFLSCSSPDDISINCIPNYILSSVYKVLPVLIQLVLTTNLWECHHYHSHFKGEETGVLRVKQIVQNYKALYPKKSDFKFGLITIILDCFSWSATGSQDQAFILVLSTSSILSSI